MIRKFVTTVAVVGMMSSPAWAQDAKAVVAAATKAMGTENRCDPRHGRRA